MSTITTGWPRANAAGSVEALFAQGLASTDSAARKPVYEEIQHYMSDNVLMVPLYARTAVTAYASRLVIAPNMSLANAFWDAEAFDVKP